MAIHWTDSSAKHGVTHDEVLFAMTHPLHVEPGFDKARDESGEEADLYIGPSRLGGPLLEVMVHQRAPRDLVVFHAMPLRNKFLALLDEEEEA